MNGITMRKTDVYQIRLNSQEKNEAFEVFKSLGITPAQGIRLFLKQVVLTKSIPFNIENLHAEPPIQHEDFVKEIASLLNEADSS